MGRGANDATQRTLEAVYRRESGRVLATTTSSPSARGDLLRRLGRTSEAVAAYRGALDLATQAPAKRFLLRRIRELTRRRETG